MASFAPKRATSAECLARWPHPPVRRVAAWLHAASRAHLVVAKNTNPGRRRGGTLALGVPTATVQKPTLKSDDPEARGSARQPPGLKDILRLSALIHDYGTVFEDHGDSLQRFQIGVRIAVHHHQVCALARFESSDLVLETHR